MGVIETRAPLFGVHIVALDFRNSHALVGPHAVLKGLQRLKAVALI